MPIPPTFSAGDNPQGPEVTFRTQDILPPGALYLGPDDILALQWFTPLPLTGQQGTLTLRLLSPEGLVSVSVYQVNMTFTAPNNPFIISPSEGFLLSATLITDAQARCEIFARFFVLRSPVGAGGQGQLLIQGYPSARGWLSYPQSPIVGPEDGDGLFTVIGINAPGAGLDWTFTIPAGMAARFITVQATLTSSAQAANRLPILKLTPPLMSTLEVFATQLLGASNEITYVFGVGQTNFTASNISDVAVSPMPPLVPGTVMNVTTVNLQNLDQWSGITFAFEQYIAG